MYSIISGTNRRGSNTIKVAEKYQEILKSKGIDSHLITLEGLDLVERNDSIRELEDDYLVPSEKIIFVSPEYNGSIPGVLKTLIDNSDIEKVWKGKKALLVGVSSGRAGNLRGMEHLTGILHYVKMIVYHNKLPISMIGKLTNDQGEIIDEATLGAINYQIDEFIDF
ncbi:MAG: NAD(P)H-dependent oxidoreductase [Chitinophagaceae bacterium]